MKRKTIKELKIATGSADDYFTIKEVVAEGVVPPEIARDVQIKIGNVINSNLSMIAIIVAAKINIPDVARKFLPFYQEIDKLAANNDVDFDLINQQLVISHCSILANIIEREERGILSAAATAVFGIKVIVNKSRLTDLVRIIMTNEESTQAASIYDLPTVLKDLYVDVIKARRIRYGSF